MNLDAECASVGMDIGKTNDETAITNALGVLQQDGVYAFYLYLASKGQDLLAKQTLEALRTVIDLNNKPPLEVAKLLVRDLDKLLFAKELLERTLIYARYHAKAKAQ